MEEEREGGAHHRKQPTHERRKRWTIRTAVGKTCEDSLGQLGEGAKEKGRHTTILQKKEEVDDSTEGE